MVYENVETIPMAVSKSSGRVTLYIDRTNFGNRSLGKGNIVNDGGAVEISTIRLDEFCALKMGKRSIDVLKNDA
jgi:hypothetical protein